MIHISPLLCARLRSDGAGSAAASAPYLVPYPVIPSGVIRLVRRYSIVFFVVVVVIFVVVVVVALEISTLRTSYHQLPPPNKKTGFVSFFAFPV